MNIKIKSSLLFTTSMLTFLLIVATAICLFFIPAVNAEEGELTEMEKFAIEADAIYSNNPMCFSNANIGRDELFHQLYYGNESKQLLMNNGFFVYSEPQLDCKNGIEVYNTSPIVGSNSAADVDINEPTIVYDANLKQWKISSSIKWTTDKWKTEDFGAQWGYIGGKSKRLGGNDLYGFQFNKFTKTFTELGIVRKKALIEGNSVDYYDRKMWNYEYEGTYKDTSTAVQAVNDETVQGAILFEFADNLVITKINAMYYETDYAAKNLYFSVNYNENFAKYDGTISTFMHHNYKKTEIKSITANFSVSGDTYTGGITIETTSVDYNWTANSGEEVTV